MKDWSTRTVVRTPTGIVVVRKPGGLWHLPGGKKDDTDLSWVHTARAELREETGIRATQFRRIVRKHNRRGKNGRYTLVYNEALIDERTVLETLVAECPEREDREEARILPFAAFKSVNDPSIDPCTRELLTKRNLLRPRVIGKKNLRAHRTRRR